MSVLIRGYRITINREGVTLIGITALILAFFAGMGYITMHFMLNINPELKPIDLTNLAEWILLFMIGIVATMLVGAALGALVILSKLVFKIEEVSEVD